MSRNRTSAKAAGTRFERAIADYLRDALGDDRIDRRVKTGSADKGDIANVRTARDERLVIEAKDVSRYDLGGWVQEAQVEAANDEAVAGLVVAKRRGYGDPADQYVICTVRDLVALIRKDPS